MLRFTQKLLKDMKVAPNELEGIPDFFSWHVNIMQLKRKYILFVHDASRLCIVLEGIRSNQSAKLIEQFRAELKQYLLYEGIQKRFMNQYLLEAGEIVIARTNSRSVLGTMNEIAFSCSVIEREFSSLMEREKWLNSLIYKPINYEEPIDVFKQSLNSYYS